MKCERCQKNPAGVRIDAIVNGKRVQHYLCRQCVDEVMSTAMNPSGGSGGPGNPEGAPLGLFSKNPNATCTSSGVNPRPPRQRSQSMRTNAYDQCRRW